jgi:serine protease Do
MIQTAGLSDGNIGISFAVPVNLAMTVAQSLISKGKWERPWLGIAMSNSTTGVVIERVLVNSPGHQDGLEAGDVIVTVDSVPVATARDVQRAVLMRTVGDPVNLLVRRNQKEIRFTIPTGAMPPRVFMPEEDEQQ